MFSRFLQPSPTPGYRQKTWDQLWGKRIGLGCCAPKHNFLQNSVGSASAIMTWIFCEMEVGAEEMDRAAAFWAKVGQGKHAIRIWQKEKKNAKSGFEFYKEKIH